MDIFFFIAKLIKIYCYMLQDTFEKCAELSLVSITIYLILKLFLYLI